MCLANPPMFLCNQDIPSYVHVHPGYRENRLICKGHLSYTNFITEYRGHTDPTMEIGMHIFSACTQYVLIQVMTLLLKEFTMFASENLCYPTTRPCSYFSTIFAAHLHENTRTMGCKRGLKEALMDQCNFYKVSMIGYQYT